MLLSCPGMKYSSGLQWKLVGSWKSFSVKPLQFVLKKLETALNIKTAAGSYLKIHLALEFFPRVATRG